ncbi:hypothetical protein D3C87_1536540 [compost metagenome]
MLLSRFDHFKWCEAPGGIAGQLLQIRIEITGHRSGLEELIELDLVEIVEQTMEIDRLDFLLGQDRHVLDQKPHAGNAILAFTDDQARSRFKDLRDQFRGGDRWRHDRKLGACRQ